METKNETSLTQFTLAAQIVKSLDTVSYIERSISINEHQNFTIFHMPTGKFTLEGSNYLSWPVWLATSADPRIDGIVVKNDPLPIDLEKSWQNHYKSLGGWSFAYQNFWSDSYNKLNIFSSLLEENFKNLVGLVDPFSYKERFFSRPNLYRNGSNPLSILMIMNANSDYVQYDQVGHWLEWLPKDTSFVRIEDNLDFFNRNAGYSHNVQLTDATITFYYLSASQQKLPEVEWRTFIQQMPSSSPTHTIHNIRFCGKIGPPTGNAIAWPKRINLKHSYSRKQELSDKIQNDIYQRDFRRSFVNKTLDRVESNYKTVFTSSGKDHTSELTVEPSEFCRNNTGFADGLTTLFLDISDEVILEDGIWRMSVVDVEFNCNTITPVRLFSKDLKLTSQGVVVPEVYAKGECGSSYECAGRLV